MKRAANLSGRGNFSVIAYVDDKHVIPPDQRLDVFRVDIRYDSLRFFHQVHYRLTHRAPQFGCNIHYAGQSQNIETANFLI